jgi:hypothetical protein
MFARGPSGRYGTSSSFAPRLPGVPALLKLSLGFLQGRHAICSRHRAVDCYRPEPAQIVGTAAGLINAPDLPLAGKDGVVRAVFVDPGAEAGRTLESSKRRTPGRGVQSSAGGLFLSREPLGGHSLLKIIYRGSCNLKSLSSGGRVQGPP